MSLYQQNVRSCLLGLRPEVGLAVTALSRIFRRSVGRSRSPRTPGPQKTVGRSCNGRAVQDMGRRLGRGKLEVQYSRPMC